MPRFLFFLSLAEAYKHASMVFTLYSARVFHPTGCIVTLQLGACIRSSTEFSAEVSTLQCKKCQTAWLYSGTHTCSYRTINSDSIISDVRLTSSCARHNNNGCICSNSPLHRWGTRLVPSGLLPLLRRLLCGYLVPHRAPSTTAVAAALVPQLFQGGDAASSTRLRVKLGVAAFGY